MRYRSKKLPERFWSKVSLGPDGYHSQTGENLGPCWLWTASTTASGYGQYGIERTMTTAHRAAYLALVGPVNKPQLDHLCRVKRCCNPRHLEPVTAGENIARGDRNKGNPKTHCLNGHAFTAENTYTNPKGHRVCRICSRKNGRLNMRRYRAEKVRA